MAKNTTRLMSSSLHDVLKSARSSHFAADMNEGAITINAWQRAPGIQLDAFRIEDLFAGICWPDSPGGRASKVDVVNKL